MFFATDSSLPRLGLPGAFGKPGISSSSSSSSASASYLFPTATMSIIANSCTVAGLPEKLIAHWLASQWPPVYQKYCSMDETSNDAACCGKCNYSRSSTRIIFHPQLVNWHLLTKFVSLFFQFFYSYVCDVSVFNVFHSTLFHMRLSYLH